MYLQDLQVISKIHENRNRNTLIVHQMLSFQGKFQWVKMSQIQARSVMNLKEILSHLIKEEIIEILKAFESVMNLKLKTI